MSLFLRTDKMYLTKQQNLQLVGVFLEFVLLKHYSFYEGKKRILKVLLMFTVNMSLEDN